jgi:predicted CXXCH cytochrome family protein
MKWIRENKRDVAAFVFAVVALAFFAGFIVQGLSSSAEAVLGEGGNLGTSSGNHPHDLSASSSGVAALSEEKICIFCHTPHRALMGDGMTNASLLNAPLWNHELTTATYTVKSRYTTPVFNAVLNGTSLSNGTLALLSTPPTTVDGATRLCLSCHDGTVAVGAVYTRYPYSSGSNDIQMDTSHPCLDASGYMISSGGSCSAFIGLNLAKKHVVSIPMNDDLINDAQNKCSSGADIKLQYPWNGNTDVLLRPVGSYNLYNGSPGVSTLDASMSSDYRYKSGYNYGVQCSTCHDPHYWVSSSGVKGDKMLVAPFNSLCTACHISC